MELKEIILTFSIGLLGSACLTCVLIPALKNHQFGQYIREEGPKAHLKKAGTPTMGGIAMIASIIVAILATGISADKLVIIATMLAFGFIGFIDDYNKVAKKENEGLTPKQKLFLQILFSVLIGVYMFVKPGGTEVFIPFAKIYVDFQILYIPFVVFVEVAMANGVNLTDGLDGLASSVTTVVSLAMAVIGLAIGEPILAIVGLAIGGAAIGFLVFNWNPAKIFMGDTGSMALGGILSAVAIVTKMEFLLPIIGLIYVLEALSVIIQVTYFKKSGGKRIFRMAPLHHHFELGGMSEKKVALFFCAITLICSAVAYFATVTVR